MKYYPKDYEATRYNTIQLHIDAYNRAFKALEELSGHDKMKLIKDFYVLSSFFDESELKRLFRISLSSGKLGIMELESRQIPRNGLMISEPLEEQQFEIFKTTVYEVRRNFAYTRNIASLDLKTYLFNIPPKVLQDFKDMGVEANESQESIIQAYKGFLRTIEPLATDYKTKRLVNELMRRTVRSFNHEQPTEQQLWEILKITR